MKVSQSLLNELMGKAEDAYPNECCGLLLGGANHIELIQPAANTHPMPQTHFEIDPAALIAAHRAQRADGPQIAGFYHSHPAGPPEPSATDSAMAAHDGKIWAIIGRGQIKFWRDDIGGFKLLSYAVTGG